MTNYHSNELPSGYSVAIGGGGGGGGYIQTVPSVLQDLSALNHYAKTPFPRDHPANQRTFYSPIDDVPNVLGACLKAARESVALVMYGFDDDTLADIIKQKLEAEHVAVQLTLDSSQAGGVHEKKILAREHYPASVVAVGRSEKGAIIHDKLAVLDGILTVTGSTNWSTSGETLQDNQLTVTLDRAVAARCRARIDAIHAFVRQEPPPKKRGSRR